jgi:hypothetical protein
MAAPRSHRTAHGNHKATHLQCSCETPCRWGPARPPHCTAMRGGKQCSRSLRQVNASQKQLGHIQLTTHHNQVWASNAQVPTSPRMLSDAAAQIPAASGGKVLVLKMQGGGGAASSGLTHKETHGIAWDAHGSNNKAQGQVCVCVCVSRAQLACCQKPMNANALTQPHIQSRGSNNSNPSRPNSFTQQPSKRIRKKTAA